MNSEKDSLIECPALTEQIFHRKRDPVSRHHAGSVTAMSITGDILRPVGMLEKLYTARQVLNIYNSVIVTASYTIQSDLDDRSLYLILCEAVARSIHRHPSLCCYFEGEKTPEPKFRRLKTILIKDVLQMRNLERPASLATQLQDLHDLQWPVDVKPLWKLAVMREPPVTDDGSIGSQLHIAFVYHHVIGDGLSGSAFHWCLLQDLSDIERHRPISQEAPQAIAVPSSTTLIEPIEKLTPLPLSWLFLLGQLVKEYAPWWLVGAPSPLWAGKPAQTLDKCPFRSRVRIVTLPPDRVQGLVEESKNHSVTLTCLLTAVIVSALANKLPAAQRFVGNTPYTLRRITGTSMDEMVNQTSGFETHYSTDMLDNIRKASNVPEHIESLWDTARSLRTQMQAELARCPHDNLICLLPYVADDVQYYRKKIGKPREVTFELSNLGAFEGARGSLPKDWALETMTFTQGAQPVGPAFTVNCVSVSGGALTIAITWQESVIGEDVVEGLVGAFTSLPRLLRDGIS